MSRAKQPRITITKEEQPPPVSKLDACLTVKICVSCNGYAFSVFKDTLETVCPCGKNRETITKQLPMTAENLETLRNAFHELIKN